MRPPHRRRGWAWATVASVVLFLVAAGVTGAESRPRPGGAGVADGVAYVAGRATLGQPFQVRVPVWNAWVRPGS